MPASALLDDEFHTAPSPGRLIEPRRRTPFGLPRPILMAFVVGLLLRGLLAADVISTTGSEMTAIAQARMGTGPAETPPAPAPS